MQLNATANAGWITSGRTLYYEVNRVTLARTWKCAEGWKIAVMLPDAYVPVSIFSSSQAAKKAVEESCHEWFEKVAA